MIKEFEVPKRDGQKQKDKGKRLLAILRRHNPEIDEVCRDWERSQKKKMKERK